MKMKTRERMRQLICIIGILICFLLAGWIETRAEVIIAIPADGEQQRDSQTIIVPDENGSQKVIHCLSTETGLIVCQEL